MSRQPSKAPTQRQLRVGEEIRHVIAQAIERGEIRDPAIKGVAITVSDVVSPILKTPPLLWFRWVVVRAARSLKP